jgi:Transposase IS66 family
LWVAVTEVGTLFVEHDDRGHAASRALLGEAFDGHLVSDRWSGRRKVAERAIRKAALWRRASYGTQSLGGRRFVERILSVVATLRQQG